MTQSGTRLKLRMSVHGTKRMSGPGAPGDALHHVRQLIGIVGRYGALDKEFAALMDQLIVAKPGAMLAANALTWSIGFPMSAPPFFVGIAPTVVGGGNPERSHCLCPSQSD
jgi:hypothetical protein